MTDKLKIKLTKDQIFLVHNYYCGLPAIYNLNSPNHTVTIEISSDQIIKPEVPKDFKVLLQPGQIYESELFIKNGTGETLEINAKIINVEKSNVEKWGEALKGRLWDNTITSRCCDELADCLNAWGYSADAAYKELVGE